jgi:hypothetical protein
VDSMAPSDPARILVLVDQPLIADLIELTLNHGVYATRTAQDLPEATAAPADPAPGMPLPRAAHPTTGARELPGRSAHAPFGGHEPGQGGLQSPDRDQLWASRMMR